jgi:hypothetical protein
VESSFGSPFGYSSHEALGQNLDLIIPEQQQGSDSGPANDARLSSSP